MGSPLQPDRSQLASVGAVAQKHGLTLVLMFGSCVTGKVHDRSDLDVAVAFRDGIPDYRGFGALLTDLQEVFPEREVDLVLLERADPLLLSRIVENCILLHGDPRDLLELKIYAFKRYQDHRPYFEMETRYLHRFLAGVSTQ